MEFIDLAAQQERIRDTIEMNIRGVMKHGKYIMGPEVKELEGKLANFVGVDHAVACSSGTDALLLALMAYGVGPGDAIITSPFTFIATAEVISLLGAVPVFADIDAVTFNLDPKNVEEAIQALRNGSDGYPLPRKEGLSLTPKGVIPVDLFGLPADYDRINSVSRQQGLFVIEDAAQSFGAQYEGKRACSLGDIGCTSFFPAKPLGCYGDGGMCFTDDKNLAETMRSLSVHGQGSHKYENVRIGINGRLDTFQAAILLAKFGIFDQEIHKRNQVADSYSKLLLNGKAGVVVPQVPSGYSSVWAQYSILAKDGNHRSELQGRLKEAGIPTAIYYPKPLHLQTAFRSLGYKPGDFPVSEEAASRIFSIPMHPYLSARDQEQLTRIIEQR
jgi:UDP-2-acetamido-2-deoxy-ribo-hexuluronate aminotransferase